MGHFKQAVHTQQRFNYIFKRKSFIFSERFKRNLCDLGVITFIRNHSKEIRRHKQCKGLFTPSINVTVNIKKLHWWANWYATHSAHHSACEKKSKVPPVNVTLWRSVWTDLKLCINKHNPFTSLGITYIDKFHPLISYCFTKSRYGWTIYTVKDKCSPGKSMIIPRGFWLIPLL